MLIIVPPQITEEEWRRAPIWLRWALLLTYGSLGLMALSLSAYLVWTLLAGV